MLKQFNTRLRDKAVITAAILSVFGHDLAVADPLKFGGSNNDDNTTSPLPGPRLPKCCGAAN